MAANKIDKLTPEQEAILPIVRDEWYKHGLSTEPADREAGQNGILKVYAAASADAPPIGIWTLSPLAGSYVVTALVNDAFGIDKIVYSMPTDQPLIIAEASVKEKSGKMEVSLKFGPEWPNRKKLYKATLKKQDAYNHVGRRIGGQYWAGYYAYFDAMERIGMEGLEAIKGQIEAAKALNWWWALDKAMVMVDRPLRAVSMDEQGRLHHDEEACILYRDGWGVYAHHGTRIPPNKEFIFTDPSKVTADVILKEDNAELRRVMLEKVGYERILDKMQKVHTDEVGTYWKLDLPDDEPLALADLVDPSTGRRYLLRVDPNAYGGLKTARAAAASTWRHPDGSMVFEKPEDYLLAAEA